jgi:hypothetical protein
MWDGGTVAPVSNTATVSSLLPFSPPDRYQPVAPVVLPQATKTSHKKPKPPLTLTEKAGIASLALAGVGLVVYGVTANQVALFKHLPENVTKGTKQFFSTMWAALDKKAETVKATTALVPTVILSVEERGLRLLPQLQTYQHELATLGYTADATTLKHLQESAIALLTEQSSTLEQFSPLEQQLNKVLASVSTELSQYAGIINTAQYTKRLTQFNGTSNIPQHIVQAKAKAETLLTALQAALVKTATVPTENKLAHQQQINGLYTQLQEQQHLLETVHLYTTLRTLLAQNPENAGQLTLLDGQFNTEVSHSLRTSLQQMLNQPQYAPLFKAEAIGLIEQLAAFKAEPSVSATAKVALALAQHKLDILAKQPASNQLLHGGATQILADVLREQPELVPVVKQQIESFPNELSQYRDGVEHATVLELAHLYVSALVRRSAFSG